MMSKVPAWLKPLLVCRNRQELKAETELCLENQFAAHRRRVFWLGELSPPEEWAENPVVTRFFEQHSALHQAQVVDQKTWASLCPRADHGNVLIGPVVTAGELVGALAATRGLGQPFGPEDIAKMNALSLYFSTRWLELEAAELDASWGWLTERERDVCQGVGEGLRNRAIAERLCISEHTVKQRLKAIFRKLGVASRSQLTARWREASGRR